VNIGVPRETSRREHRVGLVPYSVARLVKAGHQVYVENGCGVESHFLDEDYSAAGASQVFRSDEVYQRSDLVCRVSALDTAQAELLRPGSAVAGFLHLGVIPGETLDVLRDKHVTAIGYDIIEDGRGRKPILQAFSELAGQMVVHKAAQLLEHAEGGRGIALGGIPGVPPATIVILGAGILGRAAAAMAVASGAHVIVLDDDIETLRAVLEATSGQAVTALSSERRLHQYTPIADVLIGAVSAHGGRTPCLVTEDMVQAMRPGSVILDLSIDEGGCVATSRPIPVGSPPYTVHEVIHYCVPNMTASIPRTASRALALSAIPFVFELAERGVEAALRSNPGLARGTYLHRGKVVHALAAETLGVEYTPLESLLT
jgi:alanine dehydrogenase